MISDHLAGSHDEALVTGCSLCDSARAGFIQFGTWTPEQEAAVRVTYQAKGDCVICERRPGDRTVNLDGRIVGICDTCWERGEDERGRND